MKPFWGITIGCKFLTLNDNFPNVVTIFYHEKQHSLAVNSVSVPAFLCNSIAFSISYVYAH